MLTYRKGQVVVGRPGELKLKKIDPKQFPRIQSKLNAITSPIALETRRSYTAGECSAEQAMVQMIAVRVTTARKLMHEKPEGREQPIGCFDLPGLVPDLSGTSPPQKLRTGQDLEGSGDIKGGTDICGETWTSISSSHAMSSRIWNVP